jgi:hypothetical protein
MSHHRGDRVREHVAGVVSLWVAAALSAGCGGADPGGAPGAEDAAASIAVQGYVHASDGAALPGVEVCERRSSEGDLEACTTSGPGGTFTLAGVPANEPLSFTFRKDGFVPSLRSILTGAYDLRLPEAENVLAADTAPRTFLGIATDPARGQVAFRVQSAGGEAPQVEATLTGVDAWPAPPGLSDDGAPAATTAAGGSGFANVPSGTYLLRVEGASATCAANPLYGLPVTLYQPAGVAAVVISVLAGYMTSPVVVSCVRAPQ